MKRKNNCVRTLWMLAAVLLVLVLLFVNLKVPAGEDLSSDNLDGYHSVSVNIPVGKEVGMQAPAFSAPVYGCDTPFKLTDYYGRIVVINFWATWCAPCINELPYFEAIEQECDGAVKVIALHSNLVTEDVSSFLTKHDYKIEFALDQTGDIIKSFGGSTMLPHTVILDKNGVIIYNAVGSLTYEKLYALVHSELLE